MRPVCRDRSADGPAAMSDDQLTATLAEIRAFDYKPVPQGSEVFEQAIRAARDVPRLLALVAVQRAALDAVLKLADELEATPYPDATAIQDCEVARTDLARGLGRIFRAAITAALTKGEATP